MKDGFQPYCISCVNQKQKQYYNEDTDEKRKFYLNNQDRLPNNQKFYNKENGDQIKEYQKKRYLDNRDQLIEYKKQYFQQNKNKIIGSYRQYVKSRRDSDLIYKLACNFRSRTSKAFKSQIVRKTNKAFDLLGCSHSFLRQWIFYQLYGNMTIENCGSVWQIDHCLPVASFNIMDEIDKKKCFNWVNLRPMYCNENNSRKTKIDHQ